MKKRFYLSVFNLTLIMMIFVFALSTPKPDSSLKKFASITGKAVNIDETPGCVTNYFSDDTVLDIIRDKIDYSRYYNLVVIKGIGNYYLLYYHSNDLHDSFGNSYYFEKGDLVCYDFDKLPNWVRIE